MISSCIGSLNEPPLVNCVIRGHQPADKLWRGSRKTLLLIPGVFRSIGWVLDDRSSGMR